MIVLDKNTKKILMETFKTKNIGLEGNITKLIDAEDDQEFKEYLKTCIEKDTTARRKRLEMTKQVQVQNKDLTELNEENQRILEELQQTLDSVEEQKSQIECQNSELLEWKNENEKIGAELVEAMKQSEQARVIAEDLYRRIRWQPQCPLDDATRGVLVVFSQRNSPTVATSTSCTTRSV